MNADNVITLTLQGPVNQMMMLFNDSHNYDNTVLYVINNASCYASAIEAIANHEGITQRKADDIVYQQNGKTYKQAFLKSQGYKMLSALNLQQLNEKIIAHFGVEDAYTTKAAHR